MSSFLPQQLDRLLRQLKFTLLLLSLSSSVVLADLTPLQRELGPPYCIVRAEAGLEGAVDAVTALWPELPREIAAGLHLAEPAPVEIVLLSGDTFRTWSNGILPEWGVGFARWPTGPIAIDVSAASRGPKTIPEIVRHELSHVYLGQRVGHAGVPRWFLEGVAQAQAGEWRWSDTFSLMRASTFGRLPSLQRIADHFPAGSGGAGQAYAISLAAVGDLDDELSQVGGWVALVDATALTGRFDLAFRELTGSTVQSWTEDFDRRIGGRYRWIGVFSQLSSVFGFMTLLFLLVLARSQWRKRKRLAEMENEESALDL